MATGKSHEENKRKPISKRTRFEIFKRDAFTCQYCGRLAPGVVLHIDHLIPVAEHGSDDPSNLVTACEECNIGKGRRELQTRIPRVQLREVEEKAKEARAQAEAYTVFRQKQVDDENHQVDEMMQTIGAIFWGPDFILGDQYRAGVRYFLTYLSPADIQQAAQKATERVLYSEGGRIKYFLKVCHNWRKERMGGQEGE